MSQDPFAQYCDRVCSMVRWKRYRAAITDELTAHMEDHADALAAKGIAPDEAAAQAAAAMGDPYEIGKTLDKLHSPWYPRLTRVFTALAALLFLVSLVIYLNIDLIDSRFVPFGDPAELVRTKITDTILCEGRATGGGTLGAYTFFDGAALLHEDDAEGSDTPIYYLELVLPSNTPCFWLDNPALAYLPFFLDGASLGDSFFNWMPQLGIFRRFSRFKVPVSPPFQRSYTLELGENSALSYTITLVEVAAQ